MKKKLIAALCLFAIVFCGIFGSIPTKASANSAAPTPNSVGSGVFFEKNTVVAVKSEVLDIVIGIKTAHIKAKYKMVNLTDEEQKIETMFFSPVFENNTSKFKLTQNGIPLEFSEKYYKIENNSTIDLENWGNAIIANTEIGNIENYDTVVSAVTYFMEFEPNGENEIVVSYDYRLGGSEEYAEVVYYLTPAKYWQSFSDLTINLTLEKTRPVLKDSSVKFKKIEGRTYQAKLDTLPVDELEIKVRQDWVLDLTAWITNPFFYTVFVFPLTVIIAIVVTVTLYVVKKMRKNKKN